jgi:hypothetical protein
LYRSVHLLSKAGGVYTAVVRIKNKQKRSQSNVGSRQREEVGHGCSIVGAVQHNSIWLDPPRNKHREAVRDPD